MIDLPKAAEFVFPKFYVADLTNLANEGYEEDLEVGLIALALQQDIVDIMDYPAMEWVYETNENGEPVNGRFQENVVGIGFQEISRQFTDGGDLERNPFTGMAVIHLKYPVEELTSISFQSIPTPKMVLDIAKYDDHIINKSVRAVSMFTGVSMEKLQGLYIGDYMVLRDEVNLLTPTPSSD